MKNKVSRTDLIIMCLVCLFCLMMAGYNNAQICRIKKSIETHLATANDSTLNNELMVVYNEE